MAYGPIFWLAWGRHEELLREAGRERLANGLRRAGKARGKTPPDDAGAKGRPDVRLGLAGDAPRIAELLELRGMPRWLAFEQRFIVAERGGKVVAVLRFGRDPRGIHLGLLVTDPQTDEGSLAGALYAGARAVARDLGVGEIRAKTRRHEAYLSRAGYREGSDGWRLEVERP